MDRINAVCRHPLFLSKMNTIRREEADRIYCRHDIQHLLDVARIMYIRVLSAKDPVFAKEAGGQDVRTFANEAGGQDARELIYAAALLHDIGRADQYEYGTPHDEAGAMTAARILGDCGFSEEAVRLITRAILGHRGRGEECSGKPGTEESAFMDPDTFAALLREADNQSRLCFACEARDTCKWPDGKKNLSIII